jgi:hypothetical protein
MVTVVPRGAALLAPERITVLIIDCPIFEIRGANSMD